MPLSSRIGYFSRTFDPRSIPGLAMWLDASAASSLTLNGSGVSQWADLSGNGRNVSQPTAVNQPTYSATAANGRPGITTTGPGYTMTSAAWTFTNTVTVFIVGKNTGNNFSSFFQRGAVNERHSGFRTSSQAFARRGSSFEAALAYTDTGWNIWQLEFSGTLSRISINGGTPASNTSSGSYAADAKALRIFGLAEFSYGLVGGIAEFLYYDATVSTADASRVRLALSQKWGVASS